MQTGWARRIAYLVLAALVFVTSCRAWSHAEPGVHSAEPAVSQIMDAS